MQLPDKFGNIGEALLWTYSFYKSHGKRDTVDGSVKPEDVRLDGHAVAVKCRAKPDIGHCRHSPAVVAKVCQSSIDTLQRHYIRRVAQTEVGGRETYLLAYTFATDDNAREYVRRAEKA